MAVSYLDVGGIKSLEPYMAAFANALGQRLSPSGKLDTAYYKDPEKWVDTAKQGWMKGTPKSIIKQFGGIIFNPKNPQEFYFEHDVSLPDWAKVAEIDPATRTMPPMNWEAEAELPAPPSYPMQNPTDIGALMRRPPLPGPPQQAPRLLVGMPYARLDAGTSGSPIFDLMNREQAMADGQHYPAILHKDEEVINPMASEVFRPILQQMNQAVPADSQAVPPIMDVGGRIEEQRLLQQRGSPWAPSQPPGVPPQTTAGRPPIVPMPIDPAQLRLLQDAGLSAPAQPVPTTSAGQAEEAVSTGYAPLGRERYVEPTLDPKKVKKITEAAEIIGEVLEDLQKEEAKGDKAAPKKRKETGKPKPAKTVPFQPGFRRAGQPMGIDWAYIQSLPTMQAQAILQQYADVGQLPRLSTQQLRAGVSPGMQRQQIMQGLMGTYKGGAEMPGVKGEAAYSAEKGKMAGGAQGIIQTDINYKKALTLQANLQRAVTQAADPMEAAKLRDLQIKQQQATVKIAGERAKLLGKSAVKAYHREYVILQVMMNPTIDPAIVMRGLDELKPEGWWTKSIKERQDETLSLEEVTDIISDFFTPTEEEGKKTTFESHKQSMGG